MELYTSLVYPLVLGVTGAMLLAGIVTAIWVRAHGVLKWVVTSMYVATAANILLIIVLLFNGVSADLPTLIGYLLVTAMVLPLLGIGRLGEPEAAAIDPDPRRPVLQPDQVARVDGFAAIIVAITMAVLVWRIQVILVAG